MKYAFFKLLLICCFLPVMIFSNQWSEGSEKVQSRKVYVDLAQVEFLENGIWIETSTGMVSIPELGYDQEGGYFYSSALEWGCPRCGAKNPASSSICRVCKWPLFDDYKSG